jgi:hypothetical protein
MEIKGPEKPISLFFFFIITNKECLKGDFGTDLLTNLTFY